MKIYEVTFEIFNADGDKNYKAVRVEAGNKKLAALRAMMEINKDQALSQLYKNIVVVREVG